MRRPSESSVVIRVRVSKETSDPPCFLYVKGSDRKINPNENRIDTTLGDLIAAISDVALEYSPDTKDAYQLAHIVLQEILKGVSLRSEIVDRRFSRVKYLY
jgi:hypothetical protein